MRTQLEREIAVAALGGSASDFLRKQVWAAFEALSSLIERNDPMLEEVLQKGHGRGYVQIGLRYGARIRVPLRVVYRQRPRQRRRPATTVRVMATLLTKGSGERHLSQPEATEELVRRCGDHVATCIKVILGLERARRQVLALMEEGTRWL